MESECHYRVGFASPHRGEVDRRSVSGDGRVRGLFAAVDTPYPLTPALSPRERERAVVAANACRQMFSVDTGSER